jgi:lipid A ethanolaminephosphotransferase
MTMPKRRLRPEICVLLVAGFVLVCLNTHFWRLLYQAVAPHGAFEWLFLGSVLLVMLALFNLMFGAFAVPYVFKPVITILLLVSAAASYFMEEYGTVIDVGLVRNIVETNASEVRDLLTLKLAAYLFLAGALPVYLLWRTPLEYRSIGRELLTKASAAVLSVAIVVVAALPFMNNFMSVFREQRQLLYFLSPFNSLHAVYKYVEKKTAAPPRPLASLGEDARKGDAWLGRKSRSLTVIAVGETARAANFSLNGYPRPTNPRLGNIEGLINFSQAYSCGTDTAQSLPCMFSNLGRSKFDVNRAAQQENLLDVVQRAGFAVRWRENQSGCKGVCLRVPTEVLVDTKPRGFYEIADGLDEALLRDLPDRIKALDRDGLFVLHMMGSHGPAYYKRYPARFEHFKPACKEAQFSRCSKDQIVNAYDNTIVYTDHVLAELIALLQEEDRQGMPTALIYLSDHGESLGESNLYLHGMPYAIAPEVQKHIPMLFWLSPRYQQTFAVDRACVAEKGRQRVSQDNLFHSVLGLLNIETQVYDAKLDVFASCRRSSD